MSESLIQVNGLTPPQYRATMTGIGEKAMKSFGTAAAWVATAAVTAYAPLKEAVAQGVATVWNLTEEFHGTTVSPHDTSLVTPVVGVLAFDNVLDHLGDAVAQGYYAKAKLDPHAVAENAALDPAKDKGLLEAMDQPEVDVFMGRKKGSPLIKGVTPAAYRDYYARLGAEGRKVLINSLRNIGPAALGLLHVDQLAALIAETATMYGIPLDAELTGVGLVGLAAMLGIRTFTTAVSGAIKIERANAHLSDAAVAENAQAFEKRMQAQQEATVVYAS